MGPSLYPLLDIDGLDGDIGGDLGDFRCLSVGERMLSILKPFVLGWLGGGVCVR